MDVRAAVARGRPAFIDRDGAAGRTQRRRGFGLLP
jgi:hypothetical protein